MKKNARYLVEVLMIAAVLCGLNGCSSINSSEDIGRSVTGVEDKQIIEHDDFSEMEETALNEEHNDTEKATLGEKLDVVEPNVADD